MSRKSSSTVTSDSHDHPDPQDANTGERQSSSADMVRAGDEGRRGRWNLFQERPGPEHVFVEQLRAAQGLMIPTNSYRYSLCKSYSSASARGRCKWARRAVAQSQRGKGTQNSSSVDCALKINNFYVTGDESLLHGFASITRCQLRATNDHVRPCRSFAYSRARCLHLPRSRPGVARKRHFAYGTKLHCMSRSQRASSTGSRLRGLLPRHFGGHDIPPTSAEALIQT